MMSLGEKAKFTCPSGMAFGQRKLIVSPMKGKGGRIPKGATLYYDVELLDFSGKPQDDYEMMEVDSNDGSDDDGEDDFFDFDKYDKEYSELKQN